MKLIARLLVAAACLQLFAHASLADTRVALIIGNGAYQNAPRLPNPPNDAADVAAALQRLEFDVIFASDVDKAGMDTATIRFARAARTADVALFYYSGHALQFAGINYLAPIDAKLTDEADLRRMVRVDEIVSDLQQAKNLRILVLDSCRDNPLADELKRSIGATRALPLQRGLAKMDSPQGMIVGYSTQSGRTADDGDGRNSPYTAAFLKNIETQLEIGTIFRRISTDVYETTNHKQLPELSLSLIGEFYFRGKLDVTVSSDPKPTPSPPDQNAAVKFAGPLAAPPSPKYVAFRDSTLVREGPGLQYGSHYKLPDGEEVIAQGKFTDDTGDFVTDHSNEWIKISTAADGEGFIEFNNLLTPKQYEKRSELVKQRNKLYGYLDRARNASGPFASASGVYPLGGGCLRPTASSGGGIHLNVGLSLLSMWVHWSEGNSAYRVNATNPDRVYEYQLIPAEKVSVNDSDVKVQMGMPVTKPDRGQIQTYRLALKDSRDQKNPDVLGARNGKLYFNRNGKITLIFSQCEPDQESELKRVWDIWLDERPRQEK